jgi:hypothetical protein
MEFLICSGRTKLFATAAPPEEDVEEARVVELPLELEPDPDLNTNSCVGHS